MPTLLHMALWLDYGGLENIIHTFSHVLRAKGYQVKIVALERDGRTFDRLRQDGFPVRLLGRRPGKFDPRLLARLVRFLREERIEVIHSHSGCIMYAALAGKLAGVRRIVHTEHGRYLPDSRGRIWEDRIFSRLIDSYVCVSADLERYMRGIIRVPASKLATIINGVDTRRYRSYGEDGRAALRRQHGYGPDEVVVGTVCRLIPKKNVEFLLDWLLSRREDGRRYRLAVIGDGPSLPRLQKMAAARPEAIRLLGMRSDVADWMNVFDVFALPSLTEGTSLTIMEAMASELPVVVSEVGGNKEIVTHERTGFLYPVNDMAAYSGLVDRLAASPGLRRELGARARQDMEARFSMNAVLGRYEALYAA
ncbi:MAG: glycosyltransferase [Desulfobacteraceae bacterium]|nr:glycosyltransferase [Desulfobacteraceae bacterium]